MEHTATDTGADTGTETATATTTDIGADTGTGTPAVRALTVGGLVSVRYAEPGLREALGERLWPTFPVDEGVRPAPFSLRIRRNPLPGARPPDHWPVVQAAAFLDGDPVLPVRVSRGSCRPQYHWYTPRDLLIDRGADIDLVSSRGDIEVTAHRVLRNHLLYPYLQARGNLPLHAAAVVAPGHGAIIFVGRSGTGKTSTSLPFVIEERWPLLANDLVFVGFREPAQAPWAQGMPENATLGIGTIANTSQLAALMPAEFQGLDPGDPRLWQIKDKVSLSMRALHRRLGVSVEAHAAVRMFVFPVVRPDTAEPIVRELRPSEVERRLLSNVTSPEYHGYTALLQAFRVDRRQSVRATVRLARGLAESVPGYLVAHDGSRMQREYLKTLMKAIL